jgi:hypothetical protein
MEESNTIGWADFPCGNHARNLHFDAYSRNFASHVKTTLGPALEVRNLYPNPPTFPSLAPMSVYRRQRHAPAVGFGLNPKAKICSEA